FGTAVNVSGIENRDASRQGRVHNGFARPVIEANPEVVASKPDFTYRERPDASRFHRRLTWRRIIARNAGRLAGSAILPVYWLSNPPVAETAHAPSAGCSDCTCNLMNRTPRSLFI